MKLKKNKQAPTPKYNIGGIIGGGVQAVAGIGQAIYGARQAKKAGKEMERLLAGAPELELPSAYQDYAKRAMDQGALRAQTEQINRRLATSTQALSQMGGRALLGGLQGATTAANQAQLDAQQAQMQREMQGMQVLGGAQQELARMREQRFGMQYEGASAAQQAGLANIGAGIGTAAGGITTLGATAYQNVEDGKKWWGGSAKNGMKTGGAFDHKTNPLSLVDKNGNIVGEATGGEYILNPKQAKAISKESKYFRNLLKQKRFK